MTDMVDWAWNPVICLLQIAPLWPVWLTWCWTPFFCLSSRLHHYDQCGWIGVEHHFSVCPSLDCTTDLCGWLGVEHRWSVCPSLDCTTDQCGWLGVKHQRSVCPPDCTAMTNVIDKVLNTRDPEICLTFSRLHRYDQCGWLGAEHQWSLFFNRLVCWVTSTWRITQDWSTCWWMGRRLKTSSACRLNRSCCAGSTTTWPVLALTDRSTTLVKTSRWVGGSNTEIWVVSFFAGGRLIFCFVLLWFILFSFGLIILMILLFERQTKQCAQLKGD